MKTRRTILAGAALVIGASSAALAGVADSPVPSLGGEPGVHVFSVPGVQSTTGGLGRVHPWRPSFFCTALESLETEPTIAVEVVNYSGGRCAERRGAPATAPPRPHAGPDGGRSRPARLRHSCRIENATITGLTPLSGDRPARIS
jgi:hypothetical protein